MATQILIDGIFFQIGRSGIARVWHKLLQHWVQQGFGDQVAVVDRQRSSPRVPGIRYLDASAFLYGNEKADRQMLQRLCDDTGARLFISTYYTVPEHTPSAMLVYDMIPEVMGYDLNEAMWRQKQVAMSEARFFSAISHSTAHDLREHLKRPELPVHVAYPGSDFQPAAADAVQAFLQRHDLARKPYLLVSGSRTGYKNVSLVFDALESMPDIRSDYTVVCTGGGQLEPEFRAKAEGLDVRIVLLNDQEMQCAYTAAAGLLYPSLYEGFGLPVLEAMACGCPVICTRRSSVPEVGGNAVLYIEPGSDPVTQMRQHLRTLLTPEARHSLVAAGRQQAQTFNWAGMAESLQAHLQDCLAQLPSPSPCRLCGHDTQPLFRQQVLGQHDVEYQHCPACGATQTETPYWLEQAYNPINEQYDTGQVTRSLINAAVLGALLKVTGLGPGARVVDYGCGSGLLVRTLRDTGVDAWGLDRYSSPRLALGFQTDTLEGADVINLCEVVEHFDQPRQAFDDLFAAQPKIVIIQTGVRASVTPDWDYLTPEHGQHIFFMSPRTLSWLCTTYRRRLLIVSGFVVLLTEDLAAHLLEPGSGALKAEHQPVLGNVLPQLWLDLFSAPYHHAGKDQQRLKQDAACTA